MTKFNISNFTKPKDAELPNSEAPQWVIDSSPKVQKAYQISLDMFDELMTKIEGKDGKRLKPRERQLVISRIAAKVPVDKSYLTKRRTEELIKFIDDLNDKLDSAWKKTGSKAAQNPQTKSELKKEVTKYKRLYNEERDHNYSDAISELLASEFYGSSKQLRQKYQDLKVENEELNKKVSNLTARLRSYSIKGVK